MWATPVRLTISQVSVEPSRGKASARAGLKVLPLISQVVLKRPPIEIVQVRSGVVRDVPGPARQGAQRARHPGPVRSAPRADPELHQRADVGLRPGAATAVVARAAAQLHRLPRRIREVDDHLGPLCRAEQDLLAAHRFRHQAAVGGDLDHRRAVGEVDVVGAEAGDVEEAQPVSPRRQTMVRHVGAVDQHQVAGHAVGGAAQAGEGIGELVVAVEAPIGDHQRDVALAGGQGQRRVELVVDDPHAGQAPPDVASGVVEPVVVVPLQRGALGMAVLAQVVDVGFSRRRARSAGRCPTFAARGRAGCRSRRIWGARRSTRPAGRRTGCGCGRRAGGRSAPPPRAGAGGGR